MDVDHGKSCLGFILFGFLLNTSCTFSDTLAVVKDRPKTVRFLPYENVPGMDKNSRLFVKAQATIAKQVAPPSASPSSSPGSTSRPVSIDRLFDLNQGELILDLDFI